MKLHIENINITLPQQMPAGLLAALAIAGAAKPAKKDIPAIGEKWPGLDAIYAGVSLSMDEDRLVHLVLYTEYTGKGMSYEDAVKYAEGVNSEMDSHIPTRHQSITLFDRLCDQFDKDWAHWTLTKTKSGKAAFIQSFDGGSQDIPSVCRVSSACRQRDSALTL